MTIRSQTNDIVQSMILSVGVHYYNNIIHERGIPDISNRVYWLHTTGEMGNMQLFTCAYNISYAIWHKQKGSLPKDMKQVKWYEVQTFAGMLDNVPERAMKEILPVMYAVAREQKCSLLRDG